MLTAATVGRLMVLVSVNKTKQNDRRKRNVRGRDPQKNPKH